MRVHGVSRQDLGAAKAAIEELFGKIGEIRRKAEASEVMVQEICRDIRKLDFAKQHLTHTITALRRLAMLVNAVGGPTGSARPQTFDLSVLLGSPSMGWSIAANSQPHAAQLAPRLALIRSWACQLHVPRLCLTDAGGSTHWS